MCRPGQTRLSMSFVLLESSLLAAWHAGWLDFQDRQETNDWKNNFTSSQVAKTNRPPISPLAHFCFRSCLSIDVFRNESRVYARIDSININRCQWEFYLVFIRQSALVELMSINHVLSMLLRGNSLHRVCWSISVGRGNRSVSLHFYFHIEISLTRWSCTDKIDESNARAFFHRL